MRKPLVFSSRTGCLLPLLIIFNLLFGWIFLRPLHWLLLTAVLILFFIVNSYIIARKIFPRRRQQDEAVDIEGEIIEDKPKLK